MVSLLWDEINTVYFKCPKMQVLFSCFFSPVQQICTQTKEVTMGSGGGNRQIYFEKVIKPQPTPEEYLSALENSPYSTHRRMAILLRPQLEQLKENEGA